MNEDLLMDWIERLVCGNLSKEDHGNLQTVLKSDADARKLFRERMDLEAGLRIWAGEDDSEATQTPVPILSVVVTPVRRISSSRWLIITSLAASVLILIGVQLRRTQFSSDKHLKTAKHAEQSQNTDAMPSRGRSISYVGTIQQRNDCQWKVQPASLNGRFATGQLSLAKGAAQLVFDSGTELVLEAPCEMQILSMDSATLLTGNAFVNVTERSNGFVLETPESLIVDQGTQYAVAMADESIEVHVFDGSVVWIPTNESSAVQDRISQGEARRYLRSEPSIATRIPFGKRQFVRRIEFDVQEQFGEQLLAYDGFENIAGRVRRGRSGFGFSGGWVPAGRGHGNAANTDEAPGGSVFGHNRDERRLMSLSLGDDIRRSFEHPIRVDSRTEDESEAALFVSLLIDRPSLPLEKSRSLEILLEPNLPGRGRSLHPVVAFGINDEGVPFVGENIADTTRLIVENEVCFIVVKLTDHLQESETSLRVFYPDETVDDVEPSIWTTAGNAEAIRFDINSIRIRCGENSVWRVDELRVGRTWRSVTSFDGEAFIDANQKRAD